MGIGNIVGGVVGAGASILGAKAQNKSAKQAAATSAANNAANLAALQQNRDFGVEYLNPYYQQGQAANPYINALVTGQDTSGLQQGLTNWQNLTGFDYQAQQAGRDVTAGAAAIGQLNSGAAAKALQERQLNLQRQNSNDYFNLLLGQQNVGANAANALVGAGNTYTNAVIGSNNTNASNQANAALARGQIQNQMYQGLGQAFGGVAQGLSGYGTVNSGLGYIY